MKSINAPAGIEGRSLEKKNADERERAYRESSGSFKQRLEHAVDSPATDDEKRVGAYKEMLEPQVRDAIIALVQKGYVTIDSGYDPRRVNEGVQYIGFKKDMIDPALLPLITARVSEMHVTPEIESDERSDYLLLIPKQFINLEKWKNVWDAAADAFPDRGAPAPLRERFIDRAGH